MKVAALYLRILRLSEIDEAVEVARVHALVPLRTHVIKVGEAASLVPHYPARVLEPRPDPYVELGVAHAARIGVGKGQVADVHLLLLIQLDVLRVAQLEEGETIKVGVGQE